MNNANQEAHGAAATAEAQGVNGTTNSAAEAAAPKPAELPRDVLARLEKLEALEADNKRYRDERKQTRAQQQALLEEQGQFKALADERAAMIEELNAKVAELEGLRTHADAWTRYQDAEAQRIEAAAAALDESDRDLLASVSDMQKRGQLLDRLLKQQTKPRAEIPKVGAPNTSNAMDVSSMSVDQLSEAARNDPSALAKLFAAGKKRTRFG